MENSCRRAMSLGLKAVAFTDHADYTDIAGGARLDVAGYLQGIEDCRRRFPALTILSGVELGEPHRFSEQAAAVLAAGDFDLVLGSLHCVSVSGHAVESSRLAEQQVSPAELMRAYFEELLDLITGPIEFEVLAHLEYPKRYWPAAAAPYQASDYREILQAVLEAAAGRGMTVELNTTRGIDPGRGLCPGAEVIRWWRQAGGSRVSLGSDAHDPSRVAGGFELAHQALESLGFSPSSLRIGIWDVTV